MNTIQTQEELRAKIALAQVEGIGGVLFRHLIAQLGSAREAFAARPDRLLKIQGIGPGVVANFKNTDAYFRTADHTLEQAAKTQVRILTYTDDAFPQRLKSLYDCPSILYSKGNFDLNYPRTVGIVGTRQVTEEGRQTTQYLIDALKASEVAIISGLAYGVDIEAHRAAIEQQVPTAAVLANGIDIVYPAVHKKYIAAMLENGGLLTESPFGMKPIRQLFLSRNRIIAGMSDVVIVVESAAKGGSLVTAEFANNYHREVFAVPGSITNPYAEGTNGLIRENKAHILTSAADVVKLMNWDLGTAAQMPKPQEKVIDWEVLSEEESAVVKVLRSRGDMQIDNLSFETGIPLNRLASLLLNLEFQDLVKALPGKKFALR